MGTHRTQTKPENAKMRLVTYEVLNNGTSQAKQVMVNEATALDELADVFNGWPAGSQFRVLETVGLD